MTGNSSAGWVLSELVHALSQLPEGVSLHVQGGGDFLDRIRPLARAYALDERLTLTEAGPRPTAWRFEGVSPSAQKWATNGSLGANLPDTMAEMVESLWPEEGGPAAVPKDDGILRGHRIVIVTNLPTHYRVPLFNGLSKRLAAAGASLRVLFLGSRARQRPWLDPRTGIDFDHEFTKSLSVPVRRRRAPLLPVDLRRRLAAFDPTIVLAAGFSPFSTLQVARYAGRKRIPFGIWSGETPFLAARRGRLAPREAERRRLARGASFGIAYGSLAARYFASIAPLLPVVIGRNTSVTEVKGRRAGRGGAPLELVAVADISIRGKGIETLVDALRLCDDVPCRLTVVGGEPDPGSRLGSAAARDDRVRFLGPQPHAEVLALLETSDAFLFPSRIDPFGLALVEAMASGLATVVSPAPGAVADLSVSGHNCLVADSGSPRSWADCIARLASDDRLRRSIAERGRRTIERRWTIAHAVEGMTAGLRLGALSSQEGR